MADSRMSFRQGLQALKDISQLSSARKPSAGLSTTIHDAALWLLAESYQLRITSVVGAEYYQVIDGWLQPSPPPYGQSEIEVNVTLTNRASYAVSGQLKAYVNGSEIASRPTTPTAFTDLPSGSQWKVTFYTYANPPGTHRLTVIALSADPSESFTFHHPVTGELVEQATFPTVAKVDHPLIAGSREQIRETLVQLLGISILDDTEGHFRAQMRANDGMTRAVSVHRLDDHPWTTSVGATFEYHEYGPYPKLAQDPAHSLSVTVRVLTGNLYELLPSSLPLPRLRVSVDGPLTATAAPGTLLWTVGSTFRSQDAKQLPYELGPTGHVRRATLNFEVALTNSYDGVAVTGEITRYDNGPTPEQKDTLPGEWYPIGATHQLANYNLYDYFNAILSRLAVFAPVLEERFPPQPAAIQTIADIAKAGTLQPLSASSTVVADPLAEGLPLWFKIGYLSTLAIGLRLSCIGFWPPNPLTAICVLATPTSIYGAYLLDKIDKAVKDVQEGRILAPSPPRSTRTPPGSTGGTVGEYPGPFPGGGGGGDGGGGGGPIDE